MSTLDCIVPVHSRDIPGLKYCLSGIRANLPELNDLWVVSAELNRQEIQRIDPAVRFADERTFIPGVDLSAADLDSRATGWLLQQFVKIYGYTRVSTDNWLVVDADVVFLNETRFLDGATAHFTVDPHRSTSPTSCALYSEFHRQLFGYANPHEYCFIAHHMVFNRACVLDFLARFRISPAKILQTDSVATFPRKGFVGFSEYDFYGAYMLRNHPEIMRLGTDRMAWRNVVWRWWDDSGATETFLGSMRRTGLKFIAAHAWLTKAVDVTPQDMLDFAGELRPDEELWGWLLRTRPHAILDHGTSGSFGITGMAAASAPAANAQTASVATIVGPVDRSNSAESIRPAASPTAPAP